MRLLFARSAGHRCCVSTRHALTLKQSVANVEVIPMSEGNVYVCLWKKRGRRITVSLKADASVKVSAPELDEAEEKMWELLCEKFGDGEAVLQYETPPPVAATQFATRYGKPHLVTVSVNDGMGRLVNEKEVHPKGYCADCRMPLEIASGATPEYDYVPSSDGAVMTEGLFFSENFLSLLSNEEKAGLKLLPVKGPARAKKRFFMLTGMPVADYVGVPGFEGLLLHQCRRCKGRLSIGYLRNSKMYHFLALKDLPKLLPTVFAIGREGNVSLCMTQERFSQLLDQPGTRNLTSRRIWVVPDDRFVRTINTRNHPLASRWEGRVASFRN
jgi:hypothetical protein